MGWTTIVMVQSMRGAPAIQVWAEGEIVPRLEVRSRHQLDPGPRLAVWTLPPGPRELHAALARARPEQVLLFAQDPGLDEAGTFVRRLAGLVKFALQAREGQFELEAAAAVTAQRALAVQAGLAVLVRRRWSWAEAAGAALGALAVLAWYDRYFRPDERSEALVLGLGLAGVYAAVLVVRGLVFRVPLGVPDAATQIVAAGLAITTIAPVTVGVLPDGVKTVAVRGEPQEARRIVLARLPGPLSGAAAQVADALSSAAARL